MKNMKRILILTLIILTLFSISTVCAGDVNDTAIASDDATGIIEEANDEEVIASSENEDDLSATTGTFTELQNLIDDAGSGSIITLDKDYAYDSGFDTQGIRINNDLTINGNGHTLDGLSKSRIFLVRSDAVFNEIKFVNGYGGSGAAISIDWGEIHEGLNIRPVYYDVTVNNCNFYNNVAELSGGSIEVSDCSKVNVINSYFTQCSADRDGGAISGGYLKVSNSVFTNNKASQKGGAIKALLKSEIKGCNFTSNSAIDGGAVYWSSSNEFDELYVGNCNFANNKAIDYGGAISGDYDMDVENSIFKNNEAESGGAIDCTGEISTAIKNSEFSNNMAHDRGGAIFGRYHVTASNCIFEKNTAKEGSALWGVEPIKCTFKGSKSTDANLIIGETAKNCIFDKPITKQTPKLTAKAATFKAKTKTKKYTAILKTNKNKAMKNVKLYLKVNGKTYTAKTNSNGKATFKITKLTKKGSHKTVITFKGNKNYKKISKTVKIKVK